MTVTKTTIVATFDPPRSGQPRRFTTEQKLSLLEEAKAPGSSISAVARQYGIAPSLVFRWKQMQDEGVLAGLEAYERVVAETEVKDLRTKVKEFARLLTCSRNFGTAIALACVARHQPGD